MNIIIDIETIPVQSPEHIAAIKAGMDEARDTALASVKAPGNYKDEAKIAEYIANAKAGILAEHDTAVVKAIERTSFDGGYGQIVCIAWAQDDGDTSALQVADLSLKSEAALLEVFFSDMRKLYGTHGTKPCLVGHNLNAFDIPFIWKRAMVHGIRPPLWFPRDPKPWAETTFDTMTAWSGVKDRISMDALCRILGIPGKGDGPTGADVWPMVQRGELDAVTAYCRDDVERTRALFKRMTFAADAPAPQAASPVKRKAPAPASTELAADPFA
jgi:predicted PolB exonuclease-like 3'-5' exonuclease